MSPCIFSLHNVCAAIWRNKRWECAFFDHLLPPRNTGRHEFGLFLTFWRRVFVDTLRQYRPRCHHARCNSRTRSVLIGPQGQSVTPGQWPFNVQCPPCRLTGADKSLTLTALRPPPDNATIDSEHKTMNSLAGRSAGQPPPKFCRIGNWLPSDEELFRRIMDTSGSRDRSRRVTFITLSAQSIDAVTPHQSSTNFYRWRRSIWNNCSSGLSKPTCAISANSSFFLVEVGVAGDREATDSVRRVICIA